MKKLLFILSLILVSNTANAVFKIKNSVAGWAIVGPARGCDKQEFLDDIAYLKAANVISADVQNASASDPMKNVHIKPRSSRADKLAYYTRDAGVRDWFNTYVKPKAPCVHFLYRYYEDQYWSNVDIPAANNAISNTFSITFVKNNAVYNGLPIPGSKPLFLYDAPVNNRAQLNFNGLDYFLSDSSINAFTGSLDDPRTFHAPMTMSNALYMAPVGTVMDYSSKTCELRAIISV